MVWRLRRWREADRFEIRFKGEIIGGSNGLSGRGRERY